jgi:N-acetylmuramoyl-L-alanine amidase
MDIFVPTLAALLLGALAALCVGCGATTQTAMERPPDWQHPGHPKSVSSMTVTHEIAASGGVQSNHITTAATNSVESELNPATPTAGNSKTFAAKSLLSLRDWCARRGLASPRRLPNDSSAFSIGNTQGVITLTVGNSVAKWRGVDVHLGYPPELIGGQLYVQAADLQSTIEPLLLPELSPMPHARTVVLDPGHGGTDSGARSSFGLEKHYTLDWGMRLGRLLQKDGWRVFMTRTTDSDTFLSNRVAVAESVNADLFISLHFNSAAPDKSGLETYCLTPTGVSSTLTRGYPDEMHLVLPNNAFDPQNLRLALLLHGALLPVNGGRDRGVRRARFLTVLKGQNRPAVLLEGGYLSNSVEARLIATAEHRQRLAEAAATALRSILSPDALTGKNSTPASVTQ